MQVNTPKRKSKKKRRERKAKKSRRHKTNSAQHFTACVLNRVQKTRDLFSGFGKPKERSSASHLTLPNRKTCPESEYRLQRKHTYTYTPCARTHTHTISPEQQQRQKRKRLRLKNRPDSFSRKLSGSSWLKSCLRGWSESSENVVC